MPPKGRMGGKKGGKEPSPIKKYDYSAFQTSDSRRPSTPLTDKGCLARTALATDSPRSFARSL